MQNPIASTWTGKATLFSSLIVMLLFGFYVKSSDAHPISGGAADEQPYFSPNGHGHYIDSVFQERVGDKLSEIDVNYRFKLVIDIHIDKSGKVKNVTMVKAKSEPSDDAEMDTYLTDILIDIIAGMPDWNPAKSGTRAVAVHLEEELLFVGNGEE